MSEKLLNVSIAFM